MIVYKVVVTKEPSIPIEIPKYSRFKYEMVNLLNKVKENGGDGYIGRGIVDAGLEQSIPFLKTRIRKKLSE
jgi:hypothetical protein